MKKLITASDGCCDVLLHVQQHAKRTFELLLKAVHGHLMVGVVLQALMLGDACDMQKHFKQATANTESVHGKGCLMGSIITCWAHWQLSHAHLYEVDAGFTNDCNGVNASCHVFILPPSIACSLNFFLFSLSFRSFSCFSLSRFSFSASTGKQGQEAFVSHGVQPTTYVVFR